MNLPVREFCDFHFSSYGGLSVVAKGVQREHQTRTITGSGMATFNRDEPSLLIRLAILIIILSLSRAGIYIPVSPQIDNRGFAESVAPAGNMMDYTDALTGGRTGSVGVFSLGIVPFINASIVMQLMTSVIPKLKKLQRNEGPVGRQKYSQYQRLLTLLFALGQSVGQLNYLQPFILDFDLYWVFENSVALATGALVLTFMASEIDKLRLGNGTSMLIFTNILSSLPTSMDAGVLQSIPGDSMTFAILFSILLFTVLGIVYVQEAERKIPINYAYRYTCTAGNALGRSSYLPFKVNATGVMPIIFASSLLALPATVSRFTNNEFFQKLTLSLSASSPLYTPYIVALIFFFNYLYTFLQIEPKEVAENLKRSGASIPAVRPGKTTEEYLDGTLVRMSILGSAFLGLLAMGPSIVEVTTNITELRGFGGTSILILVGVASDFVRRLKAELLMRRYQNGNRTKG